MHHYWNKVLWSQLCVMCLLAVSFVPVETLWTQILYGVFASIIVLYLPGYRMSFLLFSQDELSIFERFMMSGAISLACITYLSMYVDYFSEPLTSMSAIVAALVLVVLTRLRLVTVQNRGS